MYRNRAFILSGFPSPIHIQSKITLYMLWVEANINLLKRQA